MAAGAVAAVEKAGEAGSRHKLIVISAAYINTAEIRQ